MTPSTRFLFLFSLFSSLLSIHALSIGRQRQTTPSLLPSTMPSQPNFYASLSKSDTSSRSAASLSSVFTSLDSGTADAEAESLLFEAFLARQKQLELNPYRAERPQQRIPTGRASQSLGRTYQFADVANESVVLSRKRRRSGMSFDAEGKTGLSRKSRRRFTGDKVEKDNGLRSSGD